MGVDVSAFMIYGIYGEGNDFRDEECGEEGKHRFIFKDDDLREIGASVITDGYSNDFSILGIDIFDNDKDKFIKNIQTAEENFKKLAEKYNINLEEFKPSFSLDYYYW